MRIGMSVSKCEYSLRQHPGIRARRQRLGSTGALTTVWNDDGEGLFNMDWYGVLSASRGMAAGRELDS